KIRFVQLSRDQLVRTISFSDRKPVRRQTFDVQALVGDEFEKALDVSLLGPTHVWQRIIVSALLVFRVVTAWSIRHRDDQLQLATEKRWPWNVHAGHPDDDHASFQTRDTRR